MVASHAQAWVTLYMCSSGSVIAQVHCKFWEADGDMPSEICIKILREVLHAMGKQSCLGCDDQSLVGEHDMHKARSDVWDRPPRGKTSPERKQGEGGGGEE